MRKIILMLTLFAFVGLQGVFAQTTVTGTVSSSENGETLPGVSVVVEGTSLGTTTDMDGKFVLTVPADATALVFSFVGMQKQTVAYTGQTVMNVVLKLSALDLDEFVVTALGVTREKKSLGYSVDAVDSEDLTQTRPTNVLSALSGKMAGVQIVTSSGAVGASARVNIRGNSSFRGNNQPLFVVDGVPLSNASTDVYDGDADYGNGAMDIDAENIESLTVLKGAAASALYGSRALNGVVLISTKKGSDVKKGLGVQYSFNAAFDKLAILPDYQNKYGQGTGGSEYDFALFQLANPGVYNTYQEFAENEAFSYYDGDWGGVNDGWDESWGPRLDIGLMLPQFDSPYTLDANGNPVYTATPWISHPDNVKDFFEIGVNQTHNLVLTAGSDNASTRFSYTNSTSTGIIPNTDQAKNSFSINSNLKLGSRLSANITATYLNTNSENLPSQGYDAGNVLQSMGQWFGRQVDLAPLEANYDKLDAFGKPYTWSYYYHNNPYWTVYKNTNARDKNRIFGGVDFTYTLSDWANLVFRAGTDNWTDNRKSIIYNQSNQNKTNGGSFTEEFMTESSKHADLILNVDKNITEDIRLTGLVGLNYRNEYYKFQSVGADELTVPNFFDISNVSGSPVTDMLMREKETNSFYMQADASYKDFLFLGGTFRNDWSSTLPSDNNSYAYYSANMGFIFSELLNIDENILSFAKFRASYALVGGDADPYALAGYYATVGSAFEGVSLYGFMRSLANANLKPETKKAFETGLDLKFFQNRLGVDLTYYKENTIDQIMAIDVSTATGFDSKWINAGELQNEGVELSVYGDILRSSSDGLNWTTQLKYAKNENSVVTLYEDLEKYQLGTDWSLTIQANPGGAYGEMVGAAFLRNDDGAIIVNADGLPEMTGTTEVLGSVMPDFNWGFANSFSYKGVNLYVLIDGRKGGDIFSVSKMFGVYAGVLDETAVGNDREVGVIAGETVMTGETFVKADGSVNDITVTANDFWGNMYKLHEFSIIDGSFIKLREISLGYDLPKSLISKMPAFKGVNISAYARNVALLWVHESNDVTIDPETGFGIGTNGLGFESTQLPSSRTIGFKITAKF